MRLKTLSKKALKPADERGLVDYFRGNHGLSIRAACKALCLSRSVYHYQPDVSRDDPVVDVLPALTDKYPRYGSRKLFKVLRRQGHTWNHKRVYRVYCLLKLNLRRKGKKRLPNKNPQALCVPELANHCWSIDFMADSLRCGRRFRTFNVVDDFNREALSIDIDLNLPAPRAIRTLDRAAAWRGYPTKLRMDNGPEFVSAALADWVEEHGVELDFIKPGKPAQNSYVEEFNRTYCTEVLDLYLFSRLSEVREVTDNWLREYNEERPHESLGYLTPREYLVIHEKSWKTLKTSGTERGRFTNSHVVTNRIMAIVNLLGRWKYQHQGQ